MKKPTVIVSVIIILIIVIGFKIYSHTESYLMSKAVDQNKPELCNDIVVPNSTSSGWPAVDTAKCLIEVARKNKNIQACTYIANAFTTDLYNCFTEVSTVPKTDSIVCEDEKIKDHGGCYAEFAIIAADKNVCLNLNDIKVKDKCISAYARKLNNNDLTLCEQISDNQYRDICIDNAVYYTHNASACSILQLQEDRDYCIKSAQQKNK